MSEEFLDGKRASFDLAGINEAHEQSKRDFSQLQFTEEKVNCKLCGGIKYTLILETEQGNLHQCKDCGFIYAGARMTKEALHILSRCYIPSIIANEDVRRESGEQRIKYIKDELDFISKIKELDENTYVLDVGCGMGDFLYYCKKYGCNVLGTDLSLYCRELGKKICEVDILAGELMDLPINPNSFDIIIMRHSIEHLREPFLELLISKILLKVDGLLYITTPEFAKDKKILEEKHMLPHHLNDFTCETLSLLLEKVGFSDIQYEDISIEPYSNMRITARKRW